METATESQRDDHAEAEDQFEFPENSDDEASSLYAVDFENNGLVWVPPEPENYDDDYREIEEEDDDDDDDVSEIEEQPAGLEEEVTTTTAATATTYSPSDQQSILVSLSSLCVWLGTVCERRRLFRIKYYGWFDQTLASFLRDHLFDQSYVCRSCEMPPEAHVHCYTHRQGTLKISVKKLAPEIILPGRKIWMWHRCLRCPRPYGFPPATRRTVMSNAASGLSFGKFLELSFSNNALATCGHSLHTDCLRFYGVGEMVACFRYVSIEIYSVYLPPSELDFNYESQEWIDRELNEVVGLAEILFSEVLNALRDLVKRPNISESGRRIADLEEVLQKEKSEFEETLERLSNKEAKEGQPVIDILELNRIRRQLVVQSSTWDQHLIHAAASPDVKCRQPAHDDTVCLLCIPFVSLLGSLNKHYLPTVGVSSFRESQLQSGSQLLLPTGVNDTVILVYDDEPSSIITYALVSLDHSLRAASDAETVVSFSDDGPHGPVEYTVACYYGKRFEELRRMWCPSEVDFVRSLSRCEKWGARGGESKTLDGRFIVKQVTKTELESFIKLAPDYFNYVSESIGLEIPTCLVKMFGVYQVTSKHLKGGKETKMDVVVIENVLFGRNPTRLYDLKGSLRSRYNLDSSGSNKVLLDQNFVEEMPISPIFVGNEAKRLLERAVWNDTAFLASINVMDYSLIVGVDDSKHELVLGMINIMRQYTWDKHLETWVKAFGGPENTSPTVINPKEYKKRFRKAMAVYFPTVADELSDNAQSSSFSE